MKSLFIYKNVKQSDTLEDYARGKLSKLGNYLDATSEVVVTFELKGKENICTIGVNGKRHYFKSKKNTDSMYEACAMSINNLKTTLSKEKDRCKTKWKRAKGLRVKLAENVLEDIDNIGDIDDSLPESELFSDDK